MSRDNKVPSTKLEDPHDWFEELRRGALLNVHGGHGTDHDVRDELLYRNSGPIVLPRATESYALYGMESALHVNEKVIRTIISKDEKRMRGLQNSSSSAGIHMSSRYDELLEKQIQNGKPLNKDLGQPLEKITFSQNNVPKVCKSITLKPDGSLEIKLPHRTIIAYKAVIPVVNLTAEEIGAKVFRNNTVYKELNRKKVEDSERKRKKVDDNQRKRKKFDVNERKRKKGDDNERKRKKVKANERNRKTVQVEKEVEGEQEILEGEQEQVENQQEVVEDDEREVVEKQWEVVEKQWEVVEKEREVVEKQWEVVEKEREVVEEDEREVVEEERVEEHYIVEEERVEHDVVADHELVDDEQELVDDEQEVVKDKKDIYSQAVDTRVTTPCSLNSDDGDVLDIFADEDDFGLD